MFGIFNIRAIQITNLTDGFENCLKAAFGSKTRRFGVSKSTFCLKQNVDLLTPKYYFTHVAFSEVSDTVNSVVKRNK